MANITDFTSVARDSIGRYFSLVSFIPSALLIAYAFILLSSGVPYHAPDPHSVVRATTHLGLADVIALFVLSLGLGLVLHPLQFAMVQLLEGYWGTGAIAQRVRATRIWWHSRRLLALRMRRGYYISQLRNVPDDEYTRERFALLSKRDEAERLSAEQPIEPHRVMPTRLGNVLRYYESNAGLPYGLDAIQVMPYLARVASAEDMDYVNDQRSNLDLAVRLSLVSVIAFALSLILLWKYGLWLLAALVPYSLALLSYRGAVIAAAAYGQAFSAIIALNRFALYERLHLPLPQSMREEQHRNATLSSVLEFKGGKSLNYKHPPP